MMICLWVFTNPALRILGEVKWIVSMPIILMKIIMV